MTLALGVAVHGSPTALAADADWWISLGVYASPTAAGKAATGLGDAQDEVPRVVAFEQDGRTLHRVVVGPYASGQRLRAALQAWRQQAHGAFALQLGAATVDAAPAPAPSEAGQTAGSAPSAPAVATAESASPAAADPMAGLRLDPAMERLLRDDAALQRELERLSRGLPRGLGSEIEAAQAHGVSLREARERTMTGPASPAVAPPGYQLHHLRRDDVAPQDAPPED